MSFESHRFNLVIQLLFSPLDRSCQKQGSIFKSEMQAFFSAVLVYFAKVLREISVEKYKEFKEADEVYSMRARTKLLASFGSQ